jgi:hypothetical protein
MWKNKDDMSTEPGPGNISRYREAVEEFSTNAAEFLKCIPMLVKTRDAYQRAMSISAEVRKILDTGDETLRRMMSQIEEAVNVQLRSQPEKRKPEAAKVEPFRSAEGTGNPQDVLTMLAHDFEKRLKED